MMKRTTKLCRRATEEVGTKWLVFGTFDDDPSGPGGVLNFNLTNCTRVDLESSDYHAAGGDAISG